MHLSWSKCCTNGSGDLTFSLGRLVSSFTHLTVCVIDGLAGRGPPLGLAVAACTRRHTLVHLPRAGPSPYGSLVCPVRTPRRSRGCALWLEACAHTTHTTALTVLTAYRYAVSVRLTGTTEAGRQRPRHIRENRGSYDRTLSPIIGDRLATGSHEARPRGGGPRED